MLLAVVDKVHNYHVSHSKEPPGHCCCTLIKHKCSQEYMMYILPPDDHSENIFQTHMPKKTDLWLQNERG